MASSRSDIYPSNPPNTSNPNTNLNYFHTSRNKRPLLHIAPPPGFPQASNPNLEPPSPFQNTAHDEA
ncbi:hypothetical protein BDZ45DRAFT_681080 [Acephala macrosclerotiorum]|nr:hypothetical protein BDZ45DRAFT_681080 [Acephala macrosclerotiorum]